MICVPLLGRDPARRDRPIRTGRRDKPIIQLPSIALRVAVIVGIAAVMFGIVFFRLWFLQILSGQEFVAQANDNRLSSVKVVAPRGYIVDRKGEVIVGNRPGEAAGIRLMDVPEGTLDEELERLAVVLHARPGRCASASRTTCIRARSSRTRTAPGPASSPGRRWRRRRSPAST